MATTLQQLLDEVTDRATAPTPSATIEDATGALGHLGWALTGLTHDGLTPGRSLRQRTVADLGTACTTVGALWPRTGGPLTDLAGAAADLIGRDRTIMGRAHRWAVTVEVAEIADHCAHLGRRLLPQSAVEELTAVRRLAAAVERDAQSDPPTASGAVMLDRLVPMPGLPGGTPPVAAVDASAALVAALDRAQQTEGLTLRGFRATVAAAEITSRYAAVFTAAMTEEGTGPPPVAALAWQLTSRTSMAFQDGRRAGPVDPRGVVPWAHALAGGLHAEVGSDADLAALRDPGALERAAATLQQVTGQLPVLADRLTTAVDRWADTGGLYIHARELPRMEEMPEDRVRAVIAGRHVQARGDDLHSLRQVVGRSADLSTALADALNRAAPPERVAQRHLAALHARQARAPGAAERLLDHAQTVAHALAATGPPLSRSPSGPRRGPQHDI